MLSDPCEAIRNENEFQFQYHENKLATGCRARQRRQSPRVVIAITLAHRIYQYALSRLIESYSCGSEFKTSLFHGETHPQPFLRLSTRAVRAQAE
jgi:hypothetical protein